MAIKRGKGQRLIPLEELRADERTEMEPADPVTGENLRTPLGFYGLRARARPIEERIPRSRQRHVV